MSSHDVFVSHSSIDKPVADAVCARLEEQRLRCWMAPRDVLPGAEYAAEIQRAIAGSRAVVFILSGASTRSHHVMRELERAVNLGLPILPFRVEDVTPDGSIGYFIAGSHWLDAVTPPMERHIERLVASVQKLLGAPVRDADAEASQREAADPSRPITAPGRPTPTVAVSVPSRETAVPERLIGKTVGRYHLKEFLGGGGAGLAFSAWDADRRQAACLKLFFPQPDGFHAEETTRTVFAALVRIDHPSIVKPMDVGRFDWEGVGTHYLAMELIDGEPLDVWLRSAPPATDSLAPRLTIAAALTEGLHAAHSCRYAGKSGIQSVGLVHGDVKPTNVMLRRDGTPVLLDFLDFRQGGRPPATEEELEGTDSCTMEMGTPGFMAPEQERQGIITFASDIYSLGLVVQQLLGYPGTTLRPAWVPAALHELVASMTARSPEARPTDLLALAQQLREAAAPPRGLWAKAVGLFRAPGAGGR